VTARTEGAMVYHEPRVAEARYLFARPPAGADIAANLLIPRQTLVGYRRGTPNYLVEPMSARPDLIPLGISMSDDLETAATSTTSSPIACQAGRVGALDNSSTDPVSESDFLSVIYAEDNFTIRRGNGDTGDGPVYSALGLYLGTKVNPETAEESHFVWIPEYPLDLPGAATDADLTAPVERAVRGGVGVNVADLAAFTVAGHYGLTFAEDDIVFLTNQTTADENGPWVVGVVATGVAPLTRPSWWAADTLQATGTVFVIQEGNGGAAGLRFVASKTDGITVDTDNPTLQLVDPPPIRTVRGVVDAAIADLTAFAVSGAGRDGLTYAAGELLLAVLQGTGSADGPYLVGTVATTAPLVRPLWWNTGSVQRAKMAFVADEGTAWQGHEWYATATGAITVGTTDPDFYPRVQNGTTAAMTAGAINVPNAWIKSITLSTITVSYNTLAGTTVGVSAPQAARTAGVPGTGEFDIAGGGSDTSTVDWRIGN